MAGGGHNSLERCILALSFIGIYFHRTHVKTSPEENSRAPRQGPSQRRRGARTTQSCRPRTCSEVAWVAWYVFTNVIYVTACCFIVCILKFSVANFTDIVFIIWSLVPTTMIFLSLLTCAFNQQSFSRLFATLARVPELDSKHGRFCSALDIALILCMVVTRASNIYYLVKKGMTPTLDEKHHVLNTIGSAAYHLCFPLLFTTIVSFNYIVRLVTRYLKQTSCALDEQSVVRGDAAARDVSALDYVDTFRRDQPAAKSCAEALLRRVEETLLLIDRGVLQITDVFSRILIFLTVMFMCDLVFSLYIVVTTLQGGKFGVIEPLAYGSEALLFLLLMHNPADALSDAEEEFTLKLREFMYGLDQEVIMACTGLELALLRRRRLTLCNFGDIGRSSFLNTMAFMLSYVVVTVQFSDA